MRTGSCESGDDKRASMASKDAYKYKYKYYCADRTPGLSELHFEDIVYFKENFYLCIIRKEIIRNILIKIAFLLLDPSLNSGKIVNTPVTTCMSAYVLRGPDSVVRVRFSRAERV